MIYAQIMDGYNPSISHIREQWEHDLGIPLSDEEWDMTLSRVHSSSICSRHALIVLQCYRGCTTLELNLQEDSQT